MTVVEEVGYKYQIGTDRLYCLRRIGFAATDLRENDVVVDLVDAVAKKNAEDEPIGLGAAKNLD
jgi:hypothetical protein